MKEIEIEIEGRVQGVGFRNTIKDYADKKKIRGFVMNKDNGSVLVVAQSDSRELNSMVDWINSNPGFSKVDSMNVNWNDTMKDYNDFKIVRTKSFVNDQFNNFINLGKSFIGKSVRIPEHVAIIPDGNRRWAKEKGIAPKYGHYKSASYENVLNIFNECIRQGIKYLTIWGFSTENWNRDKLEIDAIFNLIYKWGNRLQKDANEKNIRIRHLGRKDRLPKKLLGLISELEEETKNNDKFNFQLCLDYGGRDEIIRAVNNIIKSGVKSINEENFKDYLDTKGIPDPDLIIRTSGEKRSSGLLPYQSSYAEFYFSNIYFPDFDVNEFRKALNNFGKRERRFGGNVDKELK